MTLEELREQAAKIAPCPFCGELPTQPEPGLNYRHPDNDCFYGPSTIPLAMLDQWNRRSLPAPVALPQGGRPADDDDPHFQIGWYKGTLDRAERERDEWKERAMSLRLSTPTETPTAAAPDDGWMGRHREAIARCIEIVRETRDSFLSPEYATGQPISSFNERFACDLAAQAIEQEFAMGTIEQCRLLGKPTPMEQYRAALSTATGDEAQQGEG